MDSIQTRYEAIPYKIWVRDDGLTCSISGSIPWSNEAARARWHIEQHGFTIRDNWEGTTGFGRKPFKTESEAKEVCLQMTTKLAKRYKHMEEKRSSL